MNFIKKHWFVISIIVIILLRFLLSAFLPNFLINNLVYDDQLMIFQSNSILKGKYLGDYTIFTLIKGPFFPFILAFIKYIHVSYSIIFTILYITSCLFFMFSISKLIKDKKWLLIILIILLFNPVTYSSDVFQRLYRNSISITELLFFLGATIIFTFSNKHKIINGVFLGLTISIMFLTREDTIWTMIALLFVYAYKLFDFYKKKEKVNVLNTIKGLFPLIILFISLNLVAIINYNHYKTYTYNELKSSPFKEAYQKILEIKDDEKVDKVAIPKSTFYKLVDNVKSFKLYKEDVDALYEKFKDENGEINNGNIVWYFRNMVNHEHSFRNGEEANKYYKSLSTEIEYLFNTGVLERELVSPSVYLYIPTKNELIDIPKSVIKSVIYTSTYSGIKTLTKSDILSYDGAKYDEKNNAYSLSYRDYRNSANIPKHNPIHIEIIRIIYKYFTIIFSFVAIFLFIKNIKKKDKINILNLILIICYALIIGGISYNNATAFPSIRYSYLADIYIIQSVLILINLYRFKKKKVKAN